MTQTAEPETLAVFGHPQYYDVPGGDYAHRHAVWDLALGATLTVNSTAYGNVFQLLLNVSDTVKAEGIMVRLASAEQVAAFAHHLLRVLGGSAHELAVNLREALNGHEQLVERRAQNIAEQVLEPVRKAMREQIQRIEAEHAAAARRWADLEDELRHQIARQQSTIERLKAPTTNAGAAEAAETDGITGQVEIPLAEFLERQRRSADAIIARFQQDKTGDVQ